MIDQTINRLHYLCGIIPALLCELDVEKFSFKPTPEKWSKKEILGHLIDSAANNHQRFVRVQFESNPIIAYDQNKWNEFGYYQKMEKNQLISFWTLYNKQLLELIRLIPDKNLSRTCQMKDGTLLNIEFLINDYVVHLEHHLKQIVEYK